MHHLRTFLAVSAVALLGVPASAVARPGHQDRLGHRSEHRTYPHASRLCAAVTAGRLPQRLGGDTAQLTAACSQLNTSFTDAQNAYDTAVAPLRQQALAALQQLRQTCQQARQDNDRATCRQARQQTLATLQSLRAQVRTAAQAYVAAIQAARQAFWTTVRTLRGGASVTQDSGSTPAPGSPIPSAASVKHASR
jgi:hypothetical protein